MKLYLEDINALKPPLCQWVSQQYKVDVESIVLYIRDYLFIDASLYYKGLKVNIEAKAALYNQDTNLVVEIIEGKAKNVFLEFELIDFMKPLVKENHFFRIEGNKLIFACDELHLPILFNEVKIVNEEIHVDF